RERATTPRATAPPAATCRTLRQKSRRTRASSRSPPVSSRPCRPLGQYTASPNDIICAPGPDLDAGQMAAGGRRCKAPLAGGQAIHRLRQADVALGDAAGVVGGQRDLDLVVDVEPCGVMVELFRHQGGARHEAEDRIEVLEGERAADGVAALDLAPAG